MKDLIMKLLKMIYCTSISFIVSIVVMTIASVLSDGNMSELASVIVVSISFVGTFSSLYSK